MKRNNNKTTTPQDIKEPRKAPFSYRIPEDLAHIRSEAESRNIGVATVINERLRRLDAIEKISSPSKDQS